MAVNHRLRSVEDLQNIIPDMFAKLVPVHYMAVKLLIQEERTTTTARITYCALYRIDNRAMTQEKNA